MKRKITHIYVAGILSGSHGYYSPNTAINYLVAVRELAKWGKKILKAGFVPFAPCLDFMFWWIDNDDLTEEEIKRYSMDWLKRCDAIFLTPGWEQSKGSLAELETARKLGMPEFYSLEALVKYGSI